MTNRPPSEIRYRDADEADAPAVTELFRTAYGEGYVHPQVYDPREVKRMIYDEDTLVLVAEHAPSGRIVGTAGVLFEMGAYSDLVGEFGRLVVDPDWRGRGIGHRLMDERLARVGGRLHLGFVEVRVSTSHSARVSQAHGFFPVGALPQKLKFGNTREHAALLVRTFGDALMLRRNHPRIIPEAHGLAETALQGAGLSPDAIVDEQAAAYPPGNGHSIEELTASGYSSVLRIERGRVRNREVFGPQRLHYGLFRLEASDSRYVVAKRDDRVVGALGYMKDEV
ncbi:MAG: GNAT family N-acetyltransferase, partial [Gemmatimonadota bacterium]|nr:GNAT family N-acetyltransferase [Gemmatimonadota bacterium]